MPVDTSIYAQSNRPTVELESPQNALAKMLQLENAKQQNQMGMMKMDEYKQGVQRSNGLRGLLSQQYDNPQAREDALLKGGYTDESLKLGKDRRENAKVDADTEYKKLEATHKRVEMISQGLGYLKDNPTPENVQTTLQGFVQSGLMPPEVAQQKLAELQKDPTPEGIRQRATMGFQAALQAKDQLPKFETRNTGSTTDTLAINPINGSVKVANSVANTQSPDSVASNARMASDAAASRGVQIRGQNLADARSRESSGIAMSKPFEITGEDGKPVLVQQDKQGNIKPVTGYTPKQGQSKPLNEGQSKALLFGSRMQEANSVFDDLATQGKTTSPIGSTLPGVGPVITALSGEKNQKLGQAKRDFINATLRRESGAAIANSEFDNAEKQYFPQIGDGAGVIAQKKRNREIAMRGVLAEVPDSDAKVAGIRAGAKPAAVNIDSLLDKYK